MPMLIVEGHSESLIPSTTLLLAQQLHSPLQQQKFQNEGATNTYQFVTGTM